MLINIEYIVKVPKETTQDQLDAIYQLIMTYTFPMNTNPLHKKHMNQLPEKEQKLLKLSELDFLRYKIDKDILKGVNLSAIPKSLYQLYSVFFLYKNQIELNLFEPGIDYTDDKSMFEYIIQTINSSKYKNVWWQINNGLNQDWDNTDECFESFVDKYMHLLSKQIKDSLNTIPRIYLESTRNGRALGAYSARREESVLKVIGFLKRAALEEYNERDHYLLYCGSDLNSKDELKIKSNLSWSFSDGIMGGFLGDLSTGCSLHYLVTDKRRLLTFAINKSLYQNSLSLEKDLFFIPPIPNLLRLTGCYEFHHPRTKVSSLNKYVQFGSMEFTSESVKKKIGSQHVFIANQFAPEIHEKFLKELTEENYQSTATIIDSKYEVPVFGFQFSNFIRFKNMTKTELRKGEDELAESASSMLKP